MHGHKATFREGINIFQHQNVTEGCFFEKKIKKIVFFWFCFFSVQICSCERCAGLLRGVVLAAAGGAAPPSGRRGEVHPHPRSRPHVAEATDNKTLSKSYVLSLFIIYYLFILPDFIHIYVQKIICSSPVRVPLSHAKTVNSSLATSQNSQNTQCESELVDHEDTSLHDDPRLSRWPCRHPPSRR